MDRREASGGELDWLRPPPAVPRSPGGGGERATLVVDSGPDMLRFVALHSKEQVLIGTDSGVDLQLCGASVRLRHARVCAGPDRDLLVVAYDGAVAINGQSISEGVLRIGDRLQIGDVGIEVVSLSPPELSHLGRLVERISDPTRDSSGLMTEGALRLALPGLIARCARASEPLSCMVLRMEQPTARVLSDLGRLVMWGVRGADLCARLGDDRIAVVIASVDVQRLEPIRRRLLGAIARHDWRGADGDASQAPAIRIGLAEKAAAESVETWLERAELSAT